MDTESAEDESIIAVFASSAGDADVADLEGFSTNGEVFGDLGIGSAMLTKLELSLACFAEKIANLSNSMMHLETLEGEFEGIISEKDDIELDSIGKGLEFDLLSGLLYSEVRELDVFLDTLKSGIADTGEKVSSCIHLGDDFIAMQGKLRNSEQCLKQSEEQFSEIKKQSANIQRTLSSFKREENGNVEGGDIIREDDQSLNVNTIVEMQTIEQRRHILRMLEKSLASEMDLEKNVNDSRQIEEDLKLRIASLEQEIVSMEEEAIDVSERWLEADNAREILMGISKDLLCRLQISQFNLNGLSQRESELKAKLEKASADEYQEKYNVMCSEMRDMANLIVKLKENISNAEIRANSAEAECKLLTESNTKLKEELTLLKDGGLRVDLLTRQLKESDVQLQQAIASAEASQEKQSMLYSTIKDMELVIKDLKSKVSKAENRADSAEEKCIILSESNAELNEELGYLRSRLECLEGSLHQVKESKVTTAKDIGKRIKLFKNLVTQLAVERERLNKQLSSLASENKILVVKLKQTYKDPSQETSETSGTGHKVDRTWKNSSANDNEVKCADSIPDVGNVWRIDAGIFNFKQLFIAVLVLLVSAVTYLYFSDANVDVIL